MEIAGKKVVSIYLEDWQMRMVKDFLGLDCHHWTVTVDGSGGGMRYMGPSLKGVHPDPKAKRMYLTEWQRHEIKHETGESCEYIELHPAVITKYFGPPIAPTPK